MKAKTTDITTAKYSEWLASLFGACLVAFGLGVLLQRFFQSWVWPLIIIGLLMHSFGMYKTYNRNK